MHFFPSFFVFFPYRTGTPLLSECKLLYQFLAKRIDIIVIHIKNQEKTKNEKKKKKKQNYVN